MWRSRIGNWRRALRSPARPGPSGAASSSVTTRSSVQYQSLIFSVEGGVGRVTLNRPDRLNSFTADMHAELRDALGRLLPSGARVLVLRGAGRAFCAGQDLNDRTVAPGGAAVDLGESIETHYKPLMLA